MITEELLYALVHQAWNNPMALLPDSRKNNNSHNFINGNNNNNNNNATQRQLPSRHHNSHIASRHALSTASSSPLDHPELLLAYHNASHNALLRYHCDVPFLLPRMVYSVPQRASTATSSNAAQSRVRPPQRFARSHAPTVSHRGSSSRTHSRHEGETSSPPVDTMYRTSRYTELRGQTSMANTIADPARGSWGASMEEDNDVVAGDAVRPSWSPWQLRYRHASGSSGGGGPREGSGVPFDPLNYGGFGGDDDEHEERSRSTINNNDDYDMGDGAEMMGRPTVRLDSRGIERHEDVVMHRGSYPSNPRATVHFDNHHYYHQEPFARPPKRESMLPAGRGKSQYNSNTEEEDNNWDFDWKDTEDEFPDPSRPLHTTMREEEGV